MINFLFITILSFSQALSYYFYGDEERVQGFAVSENNVIMAYEQNIGVNYLYSQNGGESFSQVAQTKDFFWNSGIRDVQFRNGEFLFHHSGGKILRMNLGGEYIDSLQLSTDFLLPIKLTENENYVASLYQKNGLDATYEISFSRDNYVTDSIVSFTNELSETKRSSISDIKLVNNSLIYIYRISDFKDFEPGEGAYVESYVIKFNLENKNIDTIATYKPEEKSKYLFKIFPVNEDKFYVIEQNFLEREPDDNQSPQKYFLYVIEDNKLTYLDTLAGFRYSDKYFGDMKGDYFYLMQNMYHFWRIDISNNNIEFLIPNLIDELPKYRYLGNNFHYNAYSGNFLYNIGRDLLMEVDLELLFELNTISSAENISKVYPIPATQGQAINIELDELSDNLVIYNLSGQIAYSSNLRSRNYSVNTNKFRRGIYFAILNVNGQQMKTKIVIN